MTLNIHEYRADEESTQSFHGEDDGTFAAKVINIMYRNSHNEPMVKTTNENENLEIKCVQIAGDLYVE